MGKQLKIRKALGKVNPINFKIGFFFEKLGLAINWVFKKQLLCIYFLKNFDFALFPTLMITQH